MAPRPPRRCGRCRRSTGSSTRGRRDGPARCDQRLLHVWRPRRKMSRACKGRDVGLQRRSDVPPDDPTRVDVAHEHHAGESRPGRNVGDVGNPQAPRCGRVKAALDQVGWLHCRRIRLRGEDPLCPLRPAHIGHHHQPSGLIAADLPALTPHQRVYVPHPVDAVVLAVQPGDLRHQQLFLQCPGRRWPGIRGR